MEIAISGKVKPLAGGDRYQRGKEETNFFKVAAVAACNVERDDLLSKA
jgi:hypothetical protein